MVLVWEAEGQSVHTLILGSQALCLLLGMTAQRSSSELTGGPVVIPAAVAASDSAVIRFPLRNRNACGVSFCDAVCVWVLSVCMSVSVLCVCTLCPWR